MTEPSLQRFELDDPVHGKVPCAAILPAGGVAPQASCAFLYGGGGSRESLAEVEPLLQAWWRSGRIPPLVVATPDVGPWSFYMDDPARGLGWERFVCERFLPHVRAAFGVPTERPCGAVGISMGGYGALKIAFGHPRLLTAVAAISPMIEPAFEASEVRPRNRYHYPPEVPQALLGPERDRELYRRDHPANRARANAGELRAAELAIYLDAAGNDALHAHDGAEHLHRVLWQLDLAHEYRLRRDADHVGPDLLERLEDAFAWVATRLVPRAPAELSDHERAWLAWIDGDRRSAPPSPLPPTSPVFSRALRALLAPLRAAAEPHDPTFSRRYGVLPSDAP